MTICKGEPKKLVLKVNGCPLEQVKEFRYLGSLIAEDMKYAPRHRQSGYLRRSTTIGLLQFCGMISDALHT